MNLREKFSIKFRKHRRFRWRFSFSAVDVCDDDDYGLIISRWYEVSFPFFYVWVNVPVHRRELKKARFIDL